MANRVQRLFPVYRTYMTPAVEKCGAFTLYLIKNGHFLMDNDEVILLMKMLLLTRNGRI